MNILPLSDLHLDLFADYGESFIKTLPNQNVDVVLIAGDLSTKNLLSLALQWFAEHFSQSKILYVKGNHDNYHFFQKDIDKIIKDKEKQFSNLIWLENDSIVIDNQRFIGCTLWYPATALSIARKAGWEDFKYIIDANKLIFKWNQNSIHYLESNIQPNDVVITHMLPSYMSIAPHFKTNFNNCFFLCNMEKIIIIKKPKLWHHGHTHSSFDYMFDQTRIICNPKGYPTWINPYEPNDDFNPNLIISI